MPTYEYQCDACAHNFDEFQGINDAPLKKCPKCGKQKLRRVFGTGAAVLFKGSGFYQTDYRSDSYKAGQKADEQKQAPAKTDKADTGGTTTTPDAGGGKTGGKAGKKDSSKKTA